jgi:hypothetical protein
MRSLHAAAVLVSAAMVAPAALAAGWELGPSGQMTFGGGAAPLYKFDCTGPELVITQFGVTKLLDVQKNEPVADAAGSALPEGAALMALATDKSEPNLVPASAVRNASTGWDMTIRLPKNDPIFVSLPRAEFVTLFTTGFTQAAMLDKADRKVIAAFVRQCRGQ